MKLTKTSQLHKRPGNIPVAWKEWQNSYKLCLGPVQFGARVGGND